MKVLTLPINQINPAPYNPRKDLKPGNPEYERLKRSIDTFGCVEPLVWNKRSGNLVGGHQRFKVLVARGDRETDVSVVDLPLEKEKALNIALNKISGDWDPRKLAQLLDELVQVPDFDVQLTGFDVPDVNALIAESLPPPEVDGNDYFDVEAELAANRPLVTQSGDLVELRTLDSDQRFRAHRLLCGDCTDSAQVKRLMNGERAILFATDPPYLVGYDGTNHPGSSKLVERVKNKDWTDSYAITWDDAEANSDLYETFIRVAIDEAIGPNAAWYCWHASRRQAMVEAVWEKFGAFVHQQIIWVKDRPILTRSWYTWQHEPCFFGWVRPHKPVRRAEDYPSSIWHIPTVRIGQVTEHPTSKPLEVFRIPIRQHTRVGELCYEPFAGSGSQIIAAEQLGPLLFEGHRDPTDVWRALGTGAGFCEISRLFFARFTERHLRYFIDREASSAINTLFERDLFDRALQQHVEGISKHAFETARITQSFAAGWFNRYARETVPSDDERSRFLRMCFGKLREELRREKGG